MTNFTTSIIFLLGVFFIVFKFISFSETNQWFVLQRTTDSFPVFAHFIPEKNYQIGDLVVIPTNKLHLISPELMSATNSNVLARVIALSGDRLTLESGRILRNGVLSKIQPSTSWKHLKAQIQIPPKNIFVWPISDDGIGGLAQSSNLLAKGFTYLEKLDFSTKSDL